MMNDTFSAELRQHLVATADERPGDGRLEAIVEGVAVTRQRHRFVARLPWVGGPTAHSSSTTSPYVLIAAALTLTLVGAALAIGSGQPRRTVFEGTWIAVDRGDGSTQTVVISSGPRPAVQYTDDFAGGQVCADAAVKVFTAHGAGEIDGDRLDVSWPDGGGCGVATMPMGDGSYAYDEATDTLLDGLGAIWVRAQDGVVAPPAPIGTPEPTESSMTSSECIEIKGGSDYRGRAGSLSLTATLAAGAESWWHGGYAVIGDAFTMSDSPCGFAGHATIDAALVREVYTDSCAWEGAGVAATSAVTGFVAPSPAGGYTVTGPDEITVGGYPAKRFSVSVPVDFDASRCSENVVKVWQPDSEYDHGTIGSGQSRTYYLVDVDGAPLGITTKHGSDSDTAAVLEQIVDSLRIEKAPDGAPPSASIQPTTAPSPVGVPRGDGCIEFPDGGTYSARAGSMSLTATVPDLPGDVWQGDTADFTLLRSPCVFGGPVSIEATQLWQVYPDACMTAGTGTKVDSPAEAIAILDSQTGVDVVGPTDITIDGYNGARFEVSTPASSATCTDESFQLFDGITNAAPGATMTVYVIDVDGVALGVVIYQGEADRDLKAEAEAIVASMEIER